MATQTKTTWRTVKLKEVVSINPDAIGKNFPFEQILYTDISSVGTGMADDPTEMPLSNAPSRARRLVKNGDTILSTVRPNRRSFLYMKNPEENRVVSTGFAVLRAGDKIDSRFLYYLISNQPFTDYLTLHTKGAAYPAVDEEIIVNANIIIPEIKTQKQIADVLSAYDGLIENNTKRIKILEEIAQAIYKEWFVYFRFPGYEKIKIIDSKTDFGEIPDGWGVKKVKDFVDFIRGFEPGSNNYQEKSGTELVPFLRVGDLGARQSNIFVDRELAQGKTLSKDDIVISMDGTVGIVKIGLEGAYSSGIRKLVIKDKNLNQPFLWQLMQSESIQNIIQEHAKGTTILHASESINNMKFVLPPKNIMEFFLTQTQPVMALVLRLADENQNLRQARDLLLPKLVSGKIRV